MHRDMVYQTRVVKWKNVIEIPGAEDDYTDEGTRPETGELGAYVIILICFMSIHGGDRTPVSPRSPPKLVAYNLLCFYPNKCDARAPEGGTAAAVAA